MKKPRRKLLYIAILLSTSQILALLFNFPLGGALLFGLFASGYYLFETGEASLKELIAGISGFMISSFGLSAIGKVLILDNLCQVAESTVETGSQLPDVVPAEKVCQGFIENWITVLISNPLSNWYIWVFAVGASVLSAYVYRRYGE